MLKIISTYLVILFTINGYANVAKNDTCKGCHPTIYKEFSTSLHKKSTIFEDPLHKAIWDKHPAKTKGKYNCAKCHTPTDKRVLKALKDGTSTLPRFDKAQQEGISCITCHSIKDIDTHTKSSNTNILVNNEKHRPTLFAASKTKRGTTVKYETKTSFMGLFSSTTGSPFHDINYSNDNFYTGKVCMGCHLYKENSHGQSVCSTQMSGATNEKKNCITCHMPQVKGSATTIARSRTHTFHGFAGTHNNANMLAQYLKMDFKKTATGFQIILTNNATHNLMLHTLRLAKLNVKIKLKTDFKILKSKSFMKVLGDKGQPVFPWVATEIYKDNMLKAGETRAINYDTIVKSGNIVEAQFGYYLVNPKMVKKLNLTDNKEVTEFKILKTKSFKVK